MCERIRRLTAPGTVAVLSAALSVSAPLVNSQAQPPRALITGKGGLRRADLDTALFTIDQRSLLSCSL